MFCVFVTDSEYGIDYKTFYATVWLINVFLIVWNNLLEIHGTQKKD